MFDEFCPPVHEWRFYVDPDPYLRYVNALLGFALGALTATFLARWR